MTASAVPELPRSRFRFGDSLRVGVDGLVARPLRAALSAVGVAIGIGALVAVLGISASSRTDLVDRLGRYGNLLTAGTGQTLTGQAAPLPPTARTMIRRIPPVREVAAIGLVPGATVRRTALIPATSTGGIAVVASDAGFARALGARVASGAFLNRATATEPSVVLGASAARYLGIVDASLGQQVDIDHHLFAVVGLLAPVEIAPEVDQTALIGFDAAESLLHFDGAATRIYVRSDPDQVVAVQGVLGRTSNPAQPEAVIVSRPSDLLAARTAAAQTFSALYLGLGAVALLVGGIGIANVMVVAVLERRQEIGLRRAIGATGGHIARQFLVEAVALAAAGGLLGTALGLVASVAWGAVHGWPLTIPGPAVWGGVGVSVAVGAVAGLFPARRAARVPPSEALRAGA
jgi:putative ABC transport system permease protein